MSEYNDFVVRELAAGRCPVAGDSQHRWVDEEPPEWMDVSEWDDAQWADWHEDAGRHCSRCGISDE